MNWDIIEMAVPVLAKGTMITLQVSLLSAVFCMVLGVSLGLMSLSRNWLFPKAVGFYVDFIRGTPLLIQIFLVFFALPAVGVHFSEFWAGVTALSINTSAFVAEAVRGGVGAIEKGQTEAARSIGMRNAQILKYILLPQSYRQLVPPITNELINLLKNSSLLSVISIYELTRAGQAIIAVHFVPFEIYMLLAVYYYAMIKVISVMSRQLERRLPQW